MSTESADIRTLDDMSNGPQCRKCWTAVNYTFRFCPTCGHKVYFSLDLSNAKPEFFIELFNSLYNLLADQNNNGRNDYLPVLSEKIITRKCRIEYDDEVKKLLFSFTRGKFQPESLIDLYHQSLTITLSGYVYRVIEEFVTWKKSERLSETEKDFLMSSLFKEAEKDLNSDCYKILNRNDIVDNRVLFCLALRWDNRHLKYLLADETYQAEWYNGILSQNVALAMKCHESTYKSLMPAAKHQGIIERKQDSIQENVQQDFIFGYIVKLCESLAPY